jgi:transposase
MRFVGIDIASEDHVVAAVDATEQVLLKPTHFSEDAGGYEKLCALLGAPSDTLVAMEATGHYWQNVFAALAAAGFEIALLNPLRTRRFAEEDLARAKTDEIDALRIARFAAQKRPAASRIPDAATLELRELIRHRDRLTQTFFDHVRQLHRVVDLGFPEFTKHVRDLGSRLATTILYAYPTARSFDGLSAKQLSRVRYDGRHNVGQELATALIAAAKISVGQHHGPAYQIEARQLCEQLDLIRRQLGEIDRDVKAKLAQHEVGKLLTTIDGIGPHTAARLVAEIGDFTAFRDGNALAAYVGVVPGTNTSGKKKSLRAPLASPGHARLREALWMPTLTAVTKNPWLRAFYLRLRANGKEAKVALIASMRKLLTAVYAVATKRRPFVAHVVAQATT